MADSRRPGPTRPPVRLRPAPSLEPPFIDEDAGIWPAPGHAVSSPSTCSHADSNPGRPAGRRPRARRPRPGRPAAATTAPGARHGHSRGDPGGAPVRRHLPGDAQRLPAARPDPGAARPGATRSSCDRATRPRRVPHRAGDGAPPPTRPGRPPAPDAGLRAARRPRSRWPRWSPARAAAPGRWRCAWNSAGAAGSAPPSRSSDPEAPQPGSSASPGGRCPLAAQEREDARLLSRAGGRRSRFGSGAAVGRAVAALVLAAGAARAGRVAGRAVLGPTDLAGGTPGGAGRGGRAARPAAAGRRGGPAAGRACDGGCGCPLPMPSAERPAPAARAAPRSPRPRRPHRRWWGRSIAAPAAAARG